MCLLFCYLVIFIFIFILLAAISRGFETCNAKTVRIIAGIPSGPFVVHEKDIEKWLASVR
jgi:hypothetical protein